MSVSKDYIDEVTNNSLGSSTFSKYDREKNERLRDLKKPRKPLDKAMERKMDQQMRKDADKELDSDRNRKELLR